MDGNRIGLSVDVKQPVRPTRSLRISNHLKDYLAWKMRLVALGENGLEQQIRRGL
jgi:hypothetical protein